MDYEYGVAKIQCGKSFPVKLSRDIGYSEAREKALKKWEDYDRSFDRDCGYVPFFFKMENWQQMKLLTSCKLM